MVDLTGLVALALVAFAGGALGTALGAFAAFGVAGLLIVAGEIATISGVTLDVPGMGLLGATGLTGALGLGPAFGPHVAFAGSVAAAAFAARRGDPAVDGEYHPAKRIERPHGTQAALLAVGGGFGVLGLLLAGASNGSFGPVGGSLPWPGLPWDPISFAIVVSALLHRIAFGYPLIGVIRGGLLDMSPYERRERRAPRAGTATGDNSAAAEGHLTRLVVEPWLPHQSGWSEAALLGAATGVFAALVTYATGSVFLAFGFAALTLLLRAIGVERAPVVHHMTLPASVVVVGAAGVADPALIDATPYIAPAAIAEAVALPLVGVAGGVTGALAGLLGEVAGRVFYAHADTHLDPPAVAILLSTLLIAALDLAGLLTQNVVPTFGL